MIDDIYILEAISMFLLSLWKTYLGPIMAAATGFSYTEMLLFNVSAAIISTLKVLYLGDWIFAKRGRKKGHTFNPKLRRFLYFWKKYGFISVAILAPVLIGIPTSTIIAQRLKTPKITIVYAHAITSFFWCSIFYFSITWGLLLVEDLR